VLDRVRVYRGENGRAAKEKGEVSEVRRLFNDRTAREGFIPPCLDDVSLLRGKRRKVEVQACERLD
jgi:hypothetical protein